VLKKIIQKGFELLKSNVYRLIDKYYIALDRNYILRTQNIRLIPSEDNRRGGKYSYAEWAHVIGIFQTLLFLHLKTKRHNSILDIGCGAGLLAIASEPFLEGKGNYIGIDIRKEEIDFCCSHFAANSKFSFKHLNVSNQVYAPYQDATGTRWDVESNCIDLITALSVWTHLNEEDAIFYLKEAHRVLKPGCKAIITFFLLDDVYRKNLPKRSNKMSRFHRTPQDHWIFDQHAYGSDSWFHPVWAMSPEQAIGVTTEGLNRIINKSGLKEVAHYQGNWKETPGVFFQDILVFQKGPFEIAAVD